MKKIILFFFLGCFITVLQAQNYAIHNFNGQTVTNCTGNAVFLDSGGSFGNYSGNENYTITFCPTTTTQVVNVDFTSFSLGTGDQMCIFDGPNTLSTLAGCYYGANFGFNVIASNPTGCLTFQFISNSTDHGTGWAATVNCQTPCQLVEAKIQSSIPAIAPPDTGYIDVCPGDAVTFVGEGFYPNNDVNYHQSDATSTFEWLIEGQTFTGQTVTHVFNNPGGYRVQLQVSDTLGCKSTNRLDQRVRVSPPSYFDGTSVSSNFACFGDSIDLMGNIVLGSEDFATPLSQGDSIFLPDGTGVCYQTSLEFTEFNIGQTLTNVNDLLNICVNMEHTWIGDLDLSIICPNGQSVVLHPQVGSGANLGEPLFSNQPGIGYDYCWSPSTTNPTWQQAITSGSGLIFVNGAQTLAAGTYASSQSLTGLVGCPLNGTWQFEICDNLQIDDGYIFGWSIELNPQLYPSLETFTPQVVESYWEVDTGKIYKDTILNFVPTVGGTSTYTYHMTNEFGCTYDTTFNINTIVPPNQPTMICGNANASQFTVNWAAVPFAAYYEISINAGLWQIVNSTSYTMTGLQPNTSFFIQLRAVGGSPCDFVSPIDTITCGSLPCNLVTNLDSVTNVTCLGAADGAAYFTATTDIPPINYTLVGGFTTSSSPVMPIDTGNHTIIIADANTCRDTFFITITEPTDSFLVTGTSTNVLCGNDSTAMASVTATGGVLPYAYNWSNGEKTATITNLPQGNYTVTVSDGNNCQRILNFAVTGPPLLNLITQQTNVSCFQGNDGSITAMGSGGVGGITYSWNTNPVQTTPTITGLTAGNYTVVISDTNNCSIATTVTITEPNLLTITLDSNRVTCFGTMDGEVISSVTGGTLPYNYSWNTGDTTTTIDSLVGGMYSLTVTDHLGCVTTATVPVFEPTEIVPMFTTTQVTCFGLSDGTGTVNATGGTGTYSYLWNSSPNQTTQTMANSPGGIFTATVTDADGCSVSDTVFVFAPQKVFIDTMISTPIICYGGTEGSVFTSGFGGTGTLAYIWNNGFTDSTQSNLPAGKYSVTVSDQQGCIAIDSIDVEGPDSLEIDFTTTNLLCFEDATGSVISTITGGTVPYNYAWNTNDNSISLNNLQIGTYILTITDANNCVTIDSTTVFEPPLLTVDVDIMHPSCFGDTNGSIGLTPQGGTTPYAYTWNTSPVSTDSSLSSLEGGFYAYTIRDSNNCLIQNVALVIEPTELTLAMAKTNITCRDSANGIAAVIPTGGTAPYTYAWSNSSSQDSVLTKLEVNWYVVTVTDASGCEKSDSIFINQPTYINSLVTGTNLSCFESEDGTAGVSTNGGVGNYNYVWSNAGETVPFITNLSAGWQYVTITDGNNCPKLDSIELTQPPEILTTISSTMLTCFENNTGTTTVNASGGMGGFTYNWNDNLNQTTPIAINLGEGTYIVTVTDMINCSVQDTVAVTQPSELTLTIASTDMSCFGVPNGTATVTPTGGTVATGSDYNFVWNNNAVSQTIATLWDGNYTVSVTDDNGCLSTISTTISEPPLLTSTISQTPTSCYQGADGQAVVVASGGTPTGTGAYTYLWSTGIPQFTDTARNLIGGLTYAVTISDANGCLDSNSITIGQPTPIDLSLTSTPTLCDYSTEGTATVSALGGTGTYTYLWSSNNQDSSTATNLGTGLYIVTVTDANGCTKNGSVPITGPTAIEVITNITDILCTNDATGTIAAQAGGGTQFYNFQWSNGQGTPTITNLLAGVYTTTITDNNGCIKIDSFEVQEPAAPLSATLQKNDVTCFGYRDGEIIINANGGTRPYQYSTNDSLYTNANQLSALTVGKYIIYTKDDHNCFFTDTITITEPPLFSVDLPFDTLIEAGTELPLVPIIQNGNLPMIFDWTPKDSTLTCWDCPTPTVEHLWLDQIYYFTAIDATGCVASDDIRVRVTKTRRTYVATGFSPNGDGYNDAFFIQGGTGVEEVKLFKVYDRWGELVFEAANTPPNDATFGWDGRFKGMKAPSGVYAWMAEVVHTDGEVIVYQGNVSLVR